MWDTCSGGIDLIKKMICRKSPFYAGRSCQVFLVKCIFDLKNTYLECVSGKVKVNGNPKIKKYIYIVICLLSR